MLASPSFLSLSLLSCFLGSAHTLSSFLRLRSKPSPPPATHTSHRTSVRRQAETNPQRTVDPALSPSQGWPGPWTCPCLRPFSSVSSLGSYVAKKVYSVLEKVSLVHPAPLRPVFPWVCPIHGYSVFMFIIKATLGLAYGAQ